MKVTFFILFIETLTKEEEYRELKSISEGELMIPNFAPTVNAFVDVVSVLLCHVMSLSLCVYLS